MTDDLFDDAAPVERALRTITARFDSECPVCDGAIYAGEPITGMDGDWVCEDCAND